MKKIFICLLSFCLLHLQVHVSYNSLSFGLTKAQAQANENNTGNNGNGVTPGAAVAPSSQKKATGEQATYKVEDEKKNPKLWKGILLSSITMLAIVFMGPSIIKLCADKISAMLMGAAGIYYIAMEVINFDNYKEGSDKEMEVYADKDQDEQIEALNSAADETDEAAKTAKKKADLHNHVFIALEAAAVVSIIEFIWDGFEKRSVSFGDLCMPAAGTAKTETTGTGSDKVVKITDEGAGPKNCGSCNGEFMFGSEVERKWNPEQKIAKHHYQLFPSLNMNKSDVVNLLAYTDYSIKELEVLTSHTKSAKESFIHFSEWRNYQRGKLSSMDYRLSVDGFFENLEPKEEFMYKKVFVDVAKISMNLIFPEAHAFGNAAGKLGGLGVGAVLAVVLWDKMSKLGKPWADFIANNGLTRAVVFGVMGGLAKLAQMEVQNASDQLSDRAEQYRNLATQLTNKVKGNQIADGAGFSNINRGQGPEASIDDEEKVSKTANCFTGSPGTLKQDPNCLCKKANNCKRAEVPKIDFAGTGLPSMLSEPISMFQKGANNLYSGNLSGATSTANANGRFAGKLGKLRHKIKAKVNDHLKDSGLEPVDFAAKEKALAAQMRKAVVDGIKSMTPEQQNQLLSAFGNGSAKEQGDEKLAEAINKATNGKGLPASKGNAVAKSKDAFAGFDFGDDEKSSGDENAVDPDAIAANMKDQGMFEGDITDRPDENIFKIITTRYLKSAYPVIFEEE